MCEHTACAMCSSCGGRSDCPRPAAPSTEWDGHHDHGHRTTGRKGTCRTDCSMHAVAGSKQGRTQGNALEDLLLVLLVNGSCHIGCDEACTGHTGDGLPHVKRAHADSRDTCQVPVHKELQTRREAVHSQSRQTVLDKPCRGIHRAACNHRPHRAGTHGHSQSHRRARYPATTSQNGIQSQKECA